MAYQTNDLLDQIKLEAYIPVAQGNFTDAQILSIADGEVMNTICPTLVSMDENWYLETTDGAYTANQSDYTLPQYAMWLKLKRVDRINSGQILPIIRIDIPDLRYMQTSSTGTPHSFYLKHDVITFVPTPASGITDTYRFYIYRRPNRMVVTSAAAQVQSVNLVNGQVTYTAVPPATYTASSFHDFFKGLSPFRRIITNSQATAIAGAVQTFPVADVQGLVAGDWICVHDETVFPPAPIELHEDIKDLTIAMLMKTQSDFDSYQSTKAEIVEKIKSMMIAPGVRIVTQGKKLSLRGHPSLAFNNRGYLP